MGLFSNNKKLCPICGNPTPRLLADKVEGMPICKECAKKVYLPDGMLNQMSLDEFQEYLNFYDENQQLRDAFSSTYQFNFGFFGGDIFVDAANRLFRLCGDEKALGFEGANLKAVRILEDETLLMEGTAGQLKRFQTGVYERANSLAPQISQFQAEMREYEWAEEMRERRERDERLRGQSEMGKHPGTVMPPVVRSRPSFDAPDPVKRFYVEVELEHPYWTERRWEFSAPSFSSSDPSINDYMDSYQEKVDKLHELAVNLMQAAFGNVQEISESTNTTFQNPAGQQVIIQQAPVDTAAELQKYKALLDQGILTEEEFTAKKRQLLGI